MRSIFLITGLLLLNFNCKEEEKKEKYFIHLGVLSEHEITGMKMDVVEDSFYAENPRDAKIRAYKDITIRKLVYHDMEKISKTKKTIEGFLITDEHGKELKIDDLSDVTKDSIYILSMRDFNKLNK